MPVSRLVWRLMVQRIDRSIFAPSSLTGKGYGRQIVDASVDATPEDWLLAVLRDRSGGLWQTKAEEYPRLDLGR